jgi:hypothetical protein
MGPIRGGQTLFASWFLACGALVMAQQTQPGSRLPEGAHVVVPTAPDEIEVKGEPTFYQEYLVTSPGIRQSYVPGYVPKVSPRFLNPRIAPKRGTGAHFWQQQPEFMKMEGGHFGSTTGYEQSGVTKDSPTGDYHLGRQGITRVLQFGYPEGQRVIEPAVVPMPSRSEKAGWTIDAGKPTRVDMSEALGVTNSFPEKRGQVAGSSSLPRRSSQLANPNDACAPTGMADGVTMQKLQWERDRPTGVQRLVER